MPKQEPCKLDQPCPRDDVVPLDPATLSPAQAEELARWLARCERVVQRAETLDAKLRELVGTTAADSLYVRGLATDWDEPQLRALEELVATVEQARADNSGHSESERFERWLTQALECIVRFLEERRNSWRLPGRSH